MATHSSILAWEIPWTEEPSGVTKESDMTQCLNDEEDKPGFVLMSLYTMQTLFPVNKIGNFLPEFLALLLPGRVQAVNKEIIRQLNKILVNYEESHKVNQKGS